MKLRTVLAAVAALSLCGSAYAAPLFTPFLSVDFNGDSGSGAGPTQSGFTGDNLANSIGAGPVTFAAGSNNITLTDGAAGGNAGAFNSRNRAAITPDSPLYQDFVFLARNTNNALAGNYIQITVDGLTAGTTYEFTGYSYDPFSAGAATGNRDLFSKTLPTQYQPGATPSAFDGATPLWEAGNPADQNGYAVSFNVVADGTGKITVYEWADSASFSNQTATILNGISVGVAPEPASIGLLGIVGIGLVRRRRA